MDRSQKADAVAQLNAVFNEVGVVVIARNLGLTVAQSTVLRGKIRDVGASYKVAKNSLAKLAIKDTAYEGIEASALIPSAFRTRLPMAPPTISSLSFVLANSTTALAAATGSTELAIAVGPVSMSPMPS